MPKRYLALVAVALATAFMLAGAGCSSSAGPATWPVLDSGKPSFYYFGAPS